MSEVVEDELTEAERVEELAARIESIAEGFQNVLDSGLNMRALVLLIHDSIPAARRPTKGQIREVLEALPNLASLYLDPPAEPE